MSYSKAIEQSISKNIIELLQTLGQRCEWVDLSGKVENYIANLACTVETATSLSLYCCPDYPGVLADTSLGFRYAKGPPSDKIGYAGCMIYSTLREILPFIKIAAPAMKKVYIIMPTYPPYKYWPASDFYQFRKPIMTTGRKLISALEKGILPTGVEFELIGSYEFIEDSFFETYKGGVSKEQQYLAERKNFAVGYKNNLIVDTENFSGDRTDQVHLSEGPVSLIVRKKPSQELYLDLQSY